MPSLIESIKEAEAKAAGYAGTRLRRPRDMVLQAEIDAGAQLARWPMNAGLSLCRRARRPNTRGVP